MTSTDPSILHVDMDAFFAAVEILRRPELRGRPVVVGGSGDRGVVAAASYEARRFGIHSAMPSVRARRLCPQAVFIRGDHARYEAVSRRIMAIMAEFTPLVEPLSLDEAFLDVGGVRRLHGPSRRIAASIRDRILEEEGLHCSIGIARVKFLAKLASGRAKPRATRRGIEPGAGILEIDPDRELEFLHPLPIRSLWGVGPVTGEKLARIGVRTVGDLAALPEDVVITALGSGVGAQLHALANARDDRVVEPDRPLKSISHEETYARDRHDRIELETEILRMADAVASRARAGGHRGRTVTLKVRFGDFRTITRSRTLDRATDSARTIVSSARDLLSAVDTSPGVRLLGVGLSGLVAEGDDAEQLTLDVLSTGPDPPGERSSAGWRRAEETVDAIRRRFGDSAVGPAALADPDGIRIVRRGGQQWGPDAAGDESDGGTDGGTDGRSGGGAGAG